jgi:hypothetical protein
MFEPDSMALYGIRHPSLPSGRLHSLVYGFDRVDFVGVLVR